MRSGALKPVPNPVPSSSPLPIQTTGNATQGRCAGPFPDGAA
jgi:hypothetical protein